MGVLLSHIIVDASVARSVSDPAGNSTAIACLTLARMLESKGCQTGALMTPMLHEEWKKHAPRIMTSWLASMESRGRVRREPDRPVRDLRDAIAIVKDGGIRTALEKDLHLSEGAIINALPVASRDDKQRRYLADLEGAYERVGRIQWLNPETSSPQDWGPWIESGCTDSTVYVIGGGGGGA
ncbi:hypothetical protein [Agromyces binzhouensis]|uniref:hypothetical protein n=1 Tax=Agromyces binzhouensis TaxID=1817495 RepID=UPI0036310438